MQVSWCVKGASKQQACVCPETVEAQSFFQHKSCSVCRFIDYEEPKAKADTKNGLRAEKALWNLEIPLQLHERESNNKLLETVQKR